MSLNGSGEGEGKEDVAEVSTALQIVFKIEGSEIRLPTLWAERKFFCFCISYLEESSAASAIDRLTGLIHGRG